jgi:protease IV
MRKVVVGVLAVIGGLAIVAVLLGGVMLVGVRFGKGVVGANTVLEVDFEQAFLEDSPDDPLVELMSGKGVVVRDVVEALERAGGDARVKGLVARLGAAPMGVAQVQELRDAVAAFRAAGKWTVAYAETFGEFGPGNGAYYLASAFEEIYLLPSGDVGLTGMMYESMFLRGTLEKLGLAPRLDHRKEYKNAMNTLTERAYTEAHREAIQKVMDSQFAQMVRGVATARGLTDAQVRGLFDRGPYLGKEAVTARLVDGVAYRDEVYAKVEAKAGASPTFLSLGKYLDRAGRPHAKGDTIALVYGQGEVVRGRSGYDPVFGELTMGSDTVAGALRKAVKDDDVKAILFRVDSPGGSYVASDAIWRETVRAKQAGKPVIVSMGNVAGSGGYFVAMAADKIVAQPGTITGSIGVLGGKMLTTGLWEKLGVSWDEVHSSANARMWTGTHDYSPEEWARFQGWLDRVYEDFTGKVAEGRSLPREKVLQIAKGRIWSGEDAKAIGLVDELGGFPVALRLAREAAGLAPDTPIRLKVFPEKRTLLQALIERESGEPSDSAVLTARTLSALQPVMREARRLGLTPPRGELSMFPWGQVW